ncbi:type II toxin-antitoxin system RelE/ParE family toxin [Pseudescherichia sp.]|uniref:type II toxin-antitoxin system RelE/ParE family toxin n=1 Tax=Pseudescherichia sp. TaxID=2055881 RepID=UPI002896A12F|nr:type II toxin-antitoxin system RelE/ParE family toxin [Pseudescherichia sp.]
MIRSWKHKGLHQFYETGSTAGIVPEHAARLETGLNALSLAEVIEDLNFPGYKLHRLKGTRKNIWSLSVTGNWRLTFEFTDSDVYILNYEDYH